LQPSKNLENQRSTASKKPEREAGGIRAGAGGDHHRKPWPSN